ncbi:hypothetical protein N8616_01500 [Verrucomicrobia bacterium]|nr:hypothetical protein [Verrucomicrobiota bacterium]
MKSHIFIAPCILKISYGMDMSAQVDSICFSISKLESEFGLQQSPSHDRRQYTQEEYNKLKLICLLVKLGLSDTSKLLSDSSVDNPDSITLEDGPEPIDAEICKLKKQEHLLDDLLDEILNSSVDMDNYLMEALLLYAERE